MLSAVAGSETELLGTKVTESFWYEVKGLQRVVYDVLLRRPAAMTKGMNRTLERLRSGVESARPT